MMAVLSLLFQLAFLLTSLALRVAALLAIVAGRLVGALIALAWRYRPSFKHRAGPDRIDPVPPHPPAPKANPVFRPRPLRPRPRR